MQVFQKLEFYSGASVVISAFVQLLLFIFYLPGGEDSSTFMLLVMGFLFLLLPSAAIFIGSYWHAVKKEKIGFAILLVVGLIFISLYTVIVSIGLLTVGERSGKTIVGTIIWLFPSFFVACTLFFGVFNALKGRKSQRLP